MLNRLAVVPHVALCSLQSCFWHASEQYRAVLHCGHTLKSFRWPTTSHPSLTQYGAPSTALLRSSSRISSGFGCPGSPVTHAFRTQCTTLVKTSGGTLHVRSRHGDTDGLHLHMPNLVGVGTVFVHIAGELQAQHDDAHVGSLAAPLHRPPLHTVHGGYVLRRFPVV
jgi:hypothetical protein